MTRNQQKAFTNSAVLSPSKVDMFDVLTGGGLVMTFVALYQVSPVLAWAIAGLELYLVGLIVSIVRGLTHGAN